MSKDGSQVLHDGYRIDLMYGIADAAVHAQNKKADYESLGYKNCDVLSPTQVIAIDPYLADFCNKHSQRNVQGELEWHNDSVALWRPGGCIDTKIFLPKFYEYLKKAMGTYQDEYGKTRDYFEIHYDTQVRGVEFGIHDGKTVITGLNLGNGFFKRSVYKDSLFIFCPGESVGTLSKLGLSEPAYAGFAGVSLLLNIPISQEEIAEYENFSHCMYVHQEGVVLAWQARYIDGKVFIGVAGTKAFYGDQRPTKDQAFAKDRNLLQLNMVNDVLPALISRALGRDTKGQKLTQTDMDILENKEIARRWAGIRSVVFDGFPTLGAAYKADGTQVENAIVTTHLGSGGVSFGPAAVAVSCSAQSQNATRSPFADTVLNFAQATRRAL